MIKSYRHKGLKRFAESGSKAGIQPKHADRLRRLLTALDVASVPQDMDAPGNKLHRLERASCPSLVRKRQWQLATHILIRWGRRDFCRLPGLPLEVKNMIFNPAHPGEVLKDYLGDITVAEASRRLGVTRAHLSRILNGRAGISASMSLRLSATRRKR